MLCDLCKAFALTAIHEDFPTDLIPDTEASGDFTDRYDHGSYRTIEASAEAGCQFCRLFLCMFHRGPYRSLRVDDARTCISRTGVNEYLFHPLGPDVHTSPERSGFQIYTPNLDLIPGKLRTAFCEGLQTPFTSTSSIGRVHSWLKQCESSHAGCTRAKGSTLPTRVLDVSTAHTTGHVRLVETAGESGTYVALSYCWGGQNPYSTTTRNIVARRRSLDLQHFPQTLRDAVIFTSLLSGVAYLWVDALCIIQDDPDDWQREASKMCSVYQGSYLTLSILDSESCDTGFLQKKPLLEIVEVGGRHVAAGIARSSVTDFTIMDLVSESKLGSRAWTLQERTLAPAVLHFAADMMIWECCAGFATEDEFVKAPYVEAVSECRSVLRSDSNTGNLRLWYRLVEEYMNRALSHHGDRLMAIDGLATQFQRLRDDEYVSGYWSSDMHLGLMWFPWSRQEERLESDIPISSWDWVTAGMRVEFPFTSVAQTAQDDFLAEADISLVGHGYHARLAGGRASLLRIRGLYEAGTLFGPASDALRFVPASANSAWNSVACELDLCQEDGWEHSSAQLAFLESFDGLRYHANVYCLLLAYQPQRAFPSLKCSAYHYMIMEAVEHGDPHWEYWARATGIDRQDVPLFRRIGLGRKRIIEREDGFPLSVIEASFLSTTHGDSDASIIPAVEREEWTRTIRTQRCVRELILV